ncbi:MAG: hypothetical protein IJ088_10345, partial [Clostridia bacterium]|nr:hypothetical protein [Clostridia bacterium]
SGSSSFGVMTASIERGYQSEDFSPRQVLIDLNGVDAKAAGFRHFNGVVRLEGNTLTGELISDRNIRSWIDGIDALSRSLGKQNIPFLYVQAPYKIARDGSNLPSGLSDYGNRLADQLLNTIQKDHVSTLDLREWISDDAKQVQTYFYRTDNHWNTEGAFIAFTEIIRWIQTNIYPDLNTEYADRSLWEHHVLSNRFLGSLGKRVGEYYVGTDTPEWFIPRFTTHMSASMPVDRLFYSGSFRNVNLRMEHATSNELFTNDEYDLFMGGDYPEVNHRNPEAPNKAKVLVVKDSFMRPIEGLMSTMFTEVDVLDLHLYHEMTLNEYIALNRPDLVLMMVSPVEIGSTSVIKFGGDIPQIVGNGSRKPLIDPEPLYVPAGESNRNFGMFHLPIHAGKTYEVSIEGIHISKGSSNGVSIGVYSKSLNRMVCYTVVDVSFAELYGSRWRFRIPENLTAEDETYQLQFYSGIAGKTAGIETEYSGVTIREVE